MAAFNNPNIRQERKGKGRPQTPAGLLAGEVNFMCGFLIKDVAVTQKYFKSTEDIAWMVKQINMDIRVLKHMIKRQWKIQATNMKQGKEDANVKV
jgi:hypothetical protein